MKKILIIFISIFAFSVGGLFLYVKFHMRQDARAASVPKLRVLAYSNFLKSWGPGKDLATQFEQKHNLNIEWVEVGNAGMLLENLRGRKDSDMPDVVVGLDLLSLIEARDLIAWSPVQVDDIQFDRDLPRALVYKDFVPFDWAPMTFIFKRGDLTTPRKLSDLLKNDYANSLALQDPNLSSTGLYFLIWVLSVLGEDEGFKYLQSLKPSIRIISPSWSAAYSLFQNNQVPMVFSFFTSTIYHYVNEQDYRYQPVYFDEPHIYSVEYMGVPAACSNCEMAREFVAHVLSATSQKTIMEKNYMLPILRGVKRDTPFDFPKSIGLIDPKNYEELLQKKEIILKKWSDLRL